MAVLGSSHHVFQRIGTKFRTEAKLSNVHFTLSGQTNRKLKSNFREVKIPLSIFISALSTHIACNYYLVICIKFGIHGKILYITNEYTIIGSILKVIN